MGRQIEEGGKEDEGEERRKGQKEKGRWGGEVEKRIEGKKEGMGVNIP